MSSAVFISAFWNDFGGTSWNYFNISKLIFSLFTSQMLKAPSLSGSKTSVGRDSCSKYELDRCLPRFSQQHFLEFLISIWLILRQYHWSNVLKKNLFSLATTSLIGCAPYKNIRVSTNFTLKRNMNNGNAPSSLCVAKNSGHPKCNY